MDKKTKRNMIIVGVVELALIIFCLTVSIVVMVTFNSPDQFGTITARQLNEQNGPMIGWFQNNPTGFFLIIVLPLLIVLVVDIVYLVMYAIKKESNISEEERAILEEQAKQAAKDELRAEIMAELAAEEKSGGEQK